MSRLIDADALLEAIKTFDENYELQKTDVYDLITNAPIVQREGWVSVPIEPTDEMVKAVMLEVLYHYNLGLSLQGDIPCRELCEAMIQAAPKD